ncbi:MAG: hypothetical protein JST84_10665 [Acidobacteria bacterium]|nr:hypothetical protein [Acidobacteriota bacterium]
MEWDRLFETARLHIQAGMYAAAPEPKESIYLTMLLGLSKRVSALEAENKALRAQLQLPEPAPVQLPVPITFNQPRLLPAENDDEDDDH